MSSQKRHKFDDNSWKCTFVGYSAKTKGYQFYNLIAKQPITSCDDVVDEKNALNWKL